MENSLSDIIIKQCVMFLIWCSTHLLIQYNTSKRKCVFYAWCFFTVVDLDSLSTRISEGGPPVADFEEGTDACSDQPSTGAQRVCSPPRSVGACSCRSGLDRREAGQDARRAQWKDKTDSLALRNTLGEDVPLQSAVTWHLQRNSCCWVFGTATNWLSE